MKDPAGNPAPKEGFKTGGWYSGYQYWNGTFAPVAGAIHPASNQPGDGQPVSPEVNAQTSVQAGLTPGANQAYVDAQNARNKGGVTPATPSATPSGTPGSTTSSTSALTMPETPTIDLEGLYKSAQESSGVKKLQDDYTAKEQALIQAQSKINDNPYLSEATRVGRIAKIKDTFNNDTASLTKQIAMAQADAEMKVNLATKQFDINSEVAKTNFDKFNSLLSAGALDNASGEDIANLVRSTGISSTMIQSAIDANKKSKEKSAETQVIQSTADNGEVTVSVINKNTGEIISQQSLGKIGNVQSGTTEKPVYASSNDVEIASKALAKVDTNKDKLISEEEFGNALNIVLSQISDERIAYSAIETAFKSYQKWNW